MARIRSTARRWLAAAVAASLAATGAIAIDASAPAPAAAAYPDTFNPFAMNGGFTVYAREDITLGNTETEGSIAAGGVATKPGDGPYTIIHVAAGTADYTLPTVDGDPTRLLVGEYSPDSGGILAITSAGTTDLQLQGDLKMVQRGGPWQTMARANWIRLNLAGAGAPDQPPIIDATAQVYPGSAAPPLSPTQGNGSISTWDASGDAVAGYVEANAEADWEQAQSCLDDLVDPGTTTGYAVGVAEDAGDRVVLEPLSPDQPNVVDYAEIAGASLIQFSPGPTPGTENPLIIRVPAGTTSVVGARLDPQGAYSPYTFWDLSQLTGPVSVTAAQGRMDGSVYAPNADVTVDAAPLDGQVLGQNVVLLGGEVHSFLFAGTIACAPDSGTFRVQKALEGITADDLPADTTFTVNYTATEPGGEVTTGSLEVPASGEWVDAGTQFPIGTEIVFTEVDPGTVPGFEWGTIAIEPESITVGAGTADIVVTNTATALLGTFSVAKQVVTTDGSEPPFPEGSVAVEWTATPPGGAPPSSGTFDVPLDGTPVEPGVDFPVGTVIQLSEDASSFVPPPGWELIDSGWDPASEITIGDEATVALTLTNTIAPVADARRITIVKSVSGEAADPAFGYTITYNQAGGVRSEPVDLPVGTPVELADVDPESDTLDLAEQVPTIDGAATDAADWAAPVFLVTVDGVTTEYPSGGFDQIVELPLPDGGDVAVEVTNRLNEGTFQMVKEFSGIDGDLVPDDRRFTVGWTATTPAGTVTEGTLRLPADGTPVGPTAADGTPLTFPFGTVIDYTELTAPTLPWVIWNEPTLTPDQLVIGEDGAGTVTGTVTNTATPITGTFQVVKHLEGVTADELLVDSFTIEYTARLLGGDVETGSFELPADGTPAGPTTDDGAPKQFPIGTIVRLIEVPPAESDLPEDFDWAATTWSPANFVVIRDDTTPEIEVTNSAEPLTRFSVVKEVEGEGAGLVPADTLFPIDWWLQDEPQDPLEAGIGVPAYSPYIPVGTIAVTNENLPEIPGVVWGPVSWSVNGEPAAVGPDGRVTVQLDTQESVEPIAFTLTNQANTTPTSAFSVTKRVEGEAAGAVPDDAAFVFEYSVDAGPVQTLELSAGETLVVEDLPGSSTVRVREIPPAGVSGVNWAEAAWTADGTALAPDSDGWVTVQLTPGAELEFVAVNTAVADLPATGGGGISPVVPLGAGVLVLAGLALLAAARRVRSV